MWERLFTGCGGYQTENDLTAQVRSVGRMEMEVNIGYDGEYGFGMLEKTPIRWCCDGGR